MKVTKTTLPLFNEMYDLKFLESDITAAFIKQEEFLANLKKTKKVFKVNGLSTSVKHILENKNYRIVNYIYLNETGNSYHSIESLNNRIVGTPANSMTKTTADGVSTTVEVKTVTEPVETYFEIGLGYFSTRNNNYLKVRDLDVEKLFELANNLYYCSELQINALTRDEEKTVNTNIVHTNLDSILDVTSGTSIANKLKTNKYPSLGIINNNRYLEYNGHDVQVIAKWLMPNAKFSEAKTLSNYKLRDAETIGYIESVFEEDNMRLGVIKTRSESYWDKNLYRRLVLLSHTDTLFNYLDAGRVLIVNNFNRYSNDGNGIAKNAILGKILFTEEIIIPTKEGVNWLKAKQTSPETVLYDASMLRLQMKKYAEELRLKKEDEEEKQLLAKKLKDRIGTLKKGSKIVLNGMTIEKDKIVYEGQTLILDSKKTSWTEELLTGLTRIYEFDNINFDGVFEQFIGNLGHVDAARGTIGEVKFEIDKRTSTNKGGTASTRLYINNHRINKEELQECLRRAICYTSQADYDEFISNVSSCSLKFHRYLQIGIDFEVAGLNRNEGFSFKLPLERKKNIMYIVLGDKEYKIKDTNRLITLQGQSDLGEIMEVLMGDKIIDGLNLIDAKQLLKLAKIEYSDAVGKSEKLLKETEKQLKLVKQTNIKMDSLVIKEGYVVQGKLRQYVVESNDKCGVYEYPSGRYICIVDKSTSQVGKDKLINRLYAVANDQALAQEIHTLK